MSGTGLLLTTLARAAVASAQGGRVVVLVDGGSGSGKTTLARALVDELRRTHPTQLVSLDECYPGWRGLGPASLMVPGMIVGDAPGLPGWDWETGTQRGWRALDPRQWLVVEGCGALTPANRGLATLGVWLELDAPTRRARALARDGEYFAAHWDEWAGQEAWHAREDRPRSLADLVIDVAAGTVGP